MRKIDFLSTPHCGDINCHKMADELHEILPGRYKRDICIQYHFQIPLCRDCHTEYHNHIRESTRAVCNLWNIDSYELVRAVEQGDTGKIEEISNKIKQEYWIKEYDVNI